MIAVVQTNQLSLNGLQAQSWLTATHFTAPFTFCPAKWNISTHLFIVLSLSQCNSLVWADAAALAFHPLIFIVLFIRFHSTVLWHSLSLSLQPSLFHAFICVCVCLGEGKMMRGSLLTSSDIASYRPSELQWIIRRINGKKSRARCETLLLAVITSFHCRDKKEKGERRD